MAKQKPAAMLTLGCEFGNVSIGERTCRVGVSVARSALKLAEADKNLCCHRLTGKIIHHSDNASPDQKRMFDDAQEMDGVFDCKSFSVTGDYISFGLTFSKKDVDMKALSSFAKKSGRLEVFNVQEIIDGDDEDDEEEPAEAPPKSKRRKKKADTIAAEVADGFAAGPDRSDEDL